MLDRIKRFASSPALKIDPSSPRSGFVLGFLFGPLGVAVLLRSLLDFLLSLGVCVAILALAGLEAAPLCWLFCGAWTAFRLHRRRGAHAARPQEGPGQDRAGGQANTDPPRTGAAIADSLT